MDSPFITLSCSSGVLHFDPKLTDFGITPSDSENKNLCMNNDITRACTDTLDYEAVYKHLITDCADKEMCQVFLGNVTKHMKSEAPFKCITNTATFFIQA